MADRIQLLAEVDQLLHRQNFTKEDSARCETLLRLADSLTDRSDLRAAVMRQRDIELGRIPQIASQPDAQFMAYLRRGKDALSLEDRRRIGSERATPLRAAEGVGSGGAGGYVVPASFFDRLESILKLTDGLFDASTLFETATGSTGQGYPILDDVGNVATIVGENSSSIAGPDFVFSSLIFDQCPTWRSGLIRYSVELANDSKFDIEALIATAAGVRFARGVGASFITTLLAGAGLGVTAASTTAITGDEVFSLVDSVDPAYAANGSFLMLRSTYTAILKLKGTTNNYLFEAEFDGAGRPTLLGFPVFFSPSMGAMTAGLKPIAFGNLQSFVRHQVRGSLKLKIMTERFAELGQLAAEAYLRIQGGLLKGSTIVPINVLAMHS
jgi:HK97 family phage major capsid protein